MKVVAILALLAFLSITATYAQTAPQPFPPDTFGKVSKACSGPEGADQLQCQGYIKLSGNLCSVKNDACIALIKGCCADKVLCAKLGPKFCKGQAKPEFVKQCMDTIATFGVVDKP